MSSFVLFVDLQNGCYKVGCAAWGDELLFFTLAAHQLAGCLLSLTVLRCLSGYRGDFFFALFSAERSKYYPLECAPLHARVCR